MMEEWHQKLHNNTSPDDVVICEALLAMLRAGRDPAAYWAHLQVLHSFSRFKRLRTYPCMVPKLSLAGFCRQLQRW